MQAKAGAVMPPGQRFATLPSMTRHLLPVKTASMMSGGLPISIITRL
jgi:hypothetical protein